MFDLYFSRETLQSLQPFFIDTLVNPLSSGLTRAVLDSILDSINFVPVPPSRRKKDANVTQPKSIDVGTSSLVPPRETRANIQLKEHSVPSITPVRPAPLPPIPPVAPPGEEILLYSLRL